MKPSARRTAAENPAIERQFAAWGCTRAEQEVGLLLLKGFSHKEIARFRGGSEATVRQQAAAIYQKAGLPGRAALSAYFLEELLLPPEPRSSRGNALSGAVFGSISDRTIAEKVDLAEPCSPDSTRTG